MSITSANRRGVWTKPFFSAAVCLVVCLGGTTAPAADAERPETMRSHRSLADAPFEWPGWGDVVRVVSMRDYNTRVVFLGTSLLGLCAGVVGTFMLLRKRSLVGDVVSHASLPGIGIAFLVMEAAQPGSGKFLPGLLTGALAAGLMGVVCTTAICRYSRIKEDAALAIVLSIFFGVGIALFTIIQNIPTGNAAGLNQFIFGMAASMVASDVELIAQAAVVVLVLSGLLFKEFSLMCFDEEYAAAQGWPVGRLDLVLMGLVVGVTVIGLQSVGLLLVVALLIIPSAAARFWTDHLPAMTVLSALIGGLSAFAGVLASALFPRLAAGAVIVLAGSALFTVSMLVGSRRGILHRLRAQWELRRRVGRHDLLRAFYEAVEPQLNPDGRDGKPQRMTDCVVEFDRLLSLRSWSRQPLLRLLGRAEREHTVRLDSSGGYRLTDRGAIEARRVARNHRLWEIYLIQYADVAPSHVDRDADQIEHILEPELIEELTELLSRRHPQMVIPPSPHALDSAGNVPASSNGLSRAEAGK